MQQPEMDQQVSRSPVLKIRDSLSGLYGAWCGDHAVRQQMIFAAAAILALCAVRPPIVWVLTSLVLLVMGLAAELINGAIEVLLDRLHPDRNAAIQAAKDMSSAAAFLINATAAAIVVSAIVISVAPRL